MSENTETPTPETAPTLTPDQQEPVPATATTKRRGGKPGALRLLIHEQLAYAGAAVALADLVAVSGKPKAEVLITLNNMKVAGQVVSQTRGHYALTV